MIINLANVVEPTLERDKINGDGDLDYIDFLDTDVGPEHDSLNSDIDDYDLIDYTRVGFNPWN